MAMLGMPEKQELVDVVKNRVKENGKKWSTAHISALDDVLDVIDKEFLDSVSNKLWNWEHSIETERTLAKCDRREAEEAIRKAEQIKKDLESIGDERGKRAYMFADRMHDLFSRMNRDCREYVSYAVYAYLTGDRGYNPMEGNDEQGI